MTGAMTSANGQIGLVVNPNAGSGEKAVGEIVRKLLEVLREEQLTLIEGTLESLLAVEFGVSATLLPVPGDSSLEARETALVLLESGVDVLIGIGGDGTLCDIASAILDTGSAVRVLGIGAGSANVGPLVSLLGRDIEHLSLDALHEVRIHGIDVFLAGDLVGTAFNDVVFSNTFFGTRDGRRIDLDAAAKLSGTDRLGKPASVCGPNTWIQKNDRQMLVNENESFAQIIASPLNEGSAYAGKAISGLMCWGPYLGNHCVLAAASTVMVRTQLELDDLDNAEPLRLTHISFGENDQVAIGGLRANAVLIIDGNPTYLLSPADVVTLRIQLDAIRMLRPSTFLRGPN